MALLRTSLHKYSRKQNLFNIVIGCLFFIMGQALVWFQLNSQFVWEWWQGRPFSAVFMFGVPASFCFWYGVRLVVGEMGELWGPRFLIFGMSYLTFPILTWHFMNESMFTAKTMLCTFLAFTIVGVQFFWK